jgi:hypothetical protein
MPTTLEHALRALDEAVERAKSIQIDLTDDYLQRIAEVEALPQNIRGRQERPLAGRPVIRPVSNSGSPTNPWIGLAIAGWPSAWSTAARSHVRPDRTTCSWI